MSPFNKKPGPSVPVTTIIGPDSTLTGELRCQSTLRVSGNIIGTIRNEGDVLVAEGSRVDGDIYGKRVTVSGEVQGNIQATEFLEISAGGKVVGDITGEVLSIQEGALFQGRVNVEEPAVSPAPPVAPENNGHVELVTESVNIDSSLLAESSTQ